MHLWVSEYGCIYSGPTNSILPDGNLQLDKSDFSALLSLLNEVDESAPEIQKFFSYSRPYGREQLKVQNYVGVIQTRNGTHIEILPKLARHSDISSARALLVRMLVELQDSPFRTGTISSLNAHKMPLFELLMSQFLGHVMDIIHKGLVRTYVECTDNLVYLRGKLELAVQTRLNAARAGVFHCTYDEYAIDRPINRLVKGALQVVSRLSQDEANIQLCREALYVFDDVPASRNVDQDFRNMRRDRLMQHYLPALPSCWMILKNMNPLTQSGERKAISMLFPMERVFEDYVAAKLPGQLGGWRVRTQVAGKSLVQQHRTRQIFALRPDLLLENSNRRIVADTKWKLLNQADRANKYGITQADIYQLFAYCKKYLPDQALKIVILIYPLSERFDRPLEPFWYRENEEVLYVLPYDLQKDELVTGPYTQLFGDDAPENLVNAHI